MSEEIKTEEVTEETPTEEAPETASDIATVTWRGNTREYSLEIHGEKFRKLAAQFAENVEGEVE